MTTNYRRAARGKQSSVGAAVRRALGRTGVSLMTLMASLGGGTAAAQEQASAPADVLQEVTVTGSRIVRADGYQAPTPVSILGSEDLNKMAVTNVADAVNRLPAFAGSVTTHNAGSLSSGFYQGQSNARFYDRLGRMLRAGVRFKF
jgi:iron complex outermembrane receptor protein